MKWWRSLAAGLIVGFAALGVWRHASAVGDDVMHDFAAELHAASLRLPSADVFTVNAVTIAGESRTSITASQTSRVAWDFMAPSRSRLDGFVAVPESARAANPQGVLFRIGVSHDGLYEELFTYVLTPAASPADQGWVSVSLDLTPYAGRPISLIFNTAGPGIWGSPTLVGR